MALRRRASSSCSCVNGFFFVLIR
nr:bla [CRIM helper plasmid pAH121]